MRHAKPYRKLSRQRSHYRALMRNLALALFEKERIVTTLAKAKEVRGFIDEIIGLGKAGSLHDRRRAFALMGNKIIRLSDGTRIDPLKKVFDELAKRYAGRNGGYTRIVKTGHRPGDAAPKAILELVDAKITLVKGDDDSETEKKATKKAPAKKAASTKKKTKAAASDKTEAA